MTSGPSSLQLFRERRCGFHARQLLFRKMASAISSAGGRLRPLPTTSDVLTRRSVDRRSTDEHELRQFPLPRPDAVVPVPQDALLWTYRSPEPSRWTDGQVSELSARTAACQSYIQSRACLATAKLYGANFREVLLFQHRFSEVGAGACRRPTFVSVGRPFQTAGA